MHKTHLCFSAILLAFFAGSATAQITFDSSIESGNGTGFSEAEPGLYEFQIEPDTNSDDRQWFYFVVNGAEGETLTFRLTGTNQTNVTSHWNTAWPVASADGGTTWQHVTGPRSNTSTTFTFTHDIASDAEHIAFHFPYTWTMVQTKFPQWEAHPHATQENIGQSVQARPIELFRITDPTVPDDDKLGFWIIARQHSAEVTSSFTVERFMDYLLSEEDDAKTLRQRALINVVPMVNPDGVVAGNYRDNFMGINLNRVWDGSANNTSSPEVKAIEDQITAWMTAGNDYTFFADLHSTSGTNPHFAFHSASGVEPPLYHDPASYHADSRAYLALVNNYEPRFHPTQGASSSNDQRLAYHRQRNQYGVLAFTFEGAYNRENYGPTPSAFMTEEFHRSVGEAIARALVSYYELEPVETGLESWVLE